MEKVMIVQFSILPECLTNFKKLVDDLIKKTRLEKGCISYRLYNEVKSEYNFLIFERYVSVKALEEHQSAEYVKKFTNTITPMLSAAPKFEVL